MPGLAVRGNFREIESEERKTGKQNSGVSGVAELEANYLAWKNSRPMCLRYPIGA
jgi:hypothetical protein